jgi:hypothetical protein
MTVFSSRIELTTIVVQKASITALINLFKLNKFLSKDITMVQYRGAGGATAAEQNLLC